MDSDGYWPETNVQCTVVMVTSGRNWVSDGDDSGMGRDTNSMISIVLYTANYL